MVGSIESLPGGDLILRGISDLRGGTPSRDALLVSIGRPRLSALGLNVPEGLAEPEHALYGLLSLEGSDAAHGRYNALVRRLVSFERAPACAR